MKNKNLIKEKVSMSLLLSRLGFVPEKKNGKELTYKSIFGNPGTKKSFSVNDELGVWFDHGSGQAGDVIDFAKLYWKETPVTDVLDKIIQTAKLPLAKQGTRIKRTRIKNVAIKMPQYFIADIKSLGNNQVITDYLRSRGIWNVANHLLKEIYYYSEDHKQVKKHFFAVGWQNESGAWEVRNKHFKGCLGQSGLTIIPGDPNRLSVFKDYFTFLTKLVYQPDSDDTVIVLNTIFNLQLAIREALSYSQAAIYLNHDLAGKYATKEFLNAVSHAVDKSGEYKGYNEFNDKLLADLKSTKLLPSKPDSVPEIINLPAADNNSHG